MINLLAGGSKYEKMVAALYLSSQDKLRQPLSPFDTFQFKDLAIIMIEKVKHVGKSSDSI